MSKPSEKNKETNDLQYSINKSCKIEITEKFKIYRTVNEIFINYC